MSPNPSPRRLSLLFVAPLTVAFAGAVLLVLGARSGSAEGGHVLRATSICEAHELKARQAEDPHLQIEIPEEFDKEFPTRQACLSYAAASDPDTPGPLQPIPFSHKHHAGLYKMDCQYCHSGTDRSRMAGVPAVAVCMGCHSQFPATYDSEFAGIRTLKDHWERKTPIEWQQIHRLPEYVKFRHNRHLAAGVECQRCHGPVQEMDKVSLTPDTVWWPWLLPAKKLEMGWCIQCHRANKASQDCFTCHY
jgi:hypothetical protein